MLQQYNKNIFSNKMYEIENKNKIDKHLTLQHGFVIILKYNASKL